MPLPYCLFFSALYIFVQEKWRIPCPPKVVQKTARYTWRKLLSATQKEELTDEAMAVWVEESLQVEASCLAALRGLRGLTCFFSLCLFFVWGGNDGLMAFLMGLMMGWWWVFGVDDVQLVVGNMGGLGRLVVLGFLGLPPLKGVMLLKGVALRIPNPRDPNHRYTISWMMEMQECRILQKQLLALNGFDLHVLDWSLVQ